MKIKLRKSIHPVLKVILALVILVGVGGTSVFTYYYVYFSRLIDKRLSGQVFANTSRLYAAPEPVFAGQDASLSEIGASLRRAGYSENKTNPTGWYHVIPGGIEIFPGPDSYFKDEPGLLRIEKGQVQRIVSLKDNTERQRYDLEPQIITNLFDRSREKRRLVRFEDLPPHLVNAVLAIEDKNFFQHSGIDFLRVIKAGWDDLRGGHYQGASTLSMQLSGLFFLNRRERTWKRKLSETMITLELERRLTKQQIFEFYMNQVSFGQRGSFSINGIGEASLVYYGKDVKVLNLPEAAFLAGLMNGPSFYNPYRQPDRAKQRRNRVLDAMVQTGAITAAQRDEANQKPLGVVPPYLDQGDAPYFVDLVKDQLLERYPEKDLVSNAHRIYTGLDIDLQKIASEAIRIGMAEVDQRLVPFRKKKKLPEAQCALVALDPHTGQVLALQGGRNYGLSQLNRAVAQRQPGSSFKPFTYAAAFNSAIDGSRPLMTANTVVVDEPTVFSFDGKTYEPENFHEKFYGPTTLRNALAHSYNIATVKVAEMIGYDKVVALARAAGIKNVQPTPSVAIGSYDATPLEMAGAYTIFANGGERLDPILVSQVKARDGTVLEHAAPKPVRVLDPRVAYLMTNLMESVIQSGTGASVRGRGFTAPAAGKTGSSRDGWFAGYTSNLLLIVWVGFDDNTNLPLEGAKSALPIWTEFMKRAVTLRRYRNTLPFDPPPGVVNVEIDSETGQLSTPWCVSRVTEMYIDGSQPSELCARHGLQRVSRPGVFSNIFGIDRRGDAVKQPVPPAPPPGVASNTQPAPTTADTPVNAEAPAKKKRGFFGRIFGSGTTPKEAPKKPPQQP